jgi:hypothetical protein
MVVVIAEQLSAPALVEPEKELEEDEEDYAESSDLLSLAVFFANALLLASFVISLISLGSHPNFGGAPMIFSFIMAVPVTLLNVKHFFVPREDQGEESFAGDQDERGPVAPYVIIAVMVVVISLVYLLMSLKS